MHGPKIDARAAHTGGAAQGGLRGGQIAKEKVCLPLFSSRLLAYSEKKTDYSFPNYGRIALTDLPASIICFVPTGFKQHFAPGWAVHYVTDEEEANCAIKMKPVPGVQGIKIPVIVNTSVIAKDGELKVFKKKKEIQKPDKPDSKRIQDNFTLAPPGKKRK